MNNRFLLKLCRFFCHVKRFLEALHVFSIASKLSLHIIFNLYFSIKGLYPYSLQSLISRYQFHKYACKWGRTIWHELCTKLFIFVQMFSNSDKMFWNLCSHPIPNFLKFYNNFIKMHTKYLNHKDFMVSFLQNKYCYCPTLFP